jgi:DNA-binding FadR family transcriptional regulator
MRPASKPDTRQHALLDNLRSLVHAGEARMSERALSGQLGVNRYTLRLALQQLRDSGEIQQPRPRARPRSVKTFKRISIVENTSPAELWEIRLSMEPHIAKAAALRGTPKQLAALREAHLRADRRVFNLEHDIAFHMAIANASHNSLWVIMLDLLTDLTLDDGFKMQLPPLTSVTGFEHHEAILAAIIRRDAPAAELAMRMHLTAIRRWATGDATATDPAHGDGHGQG